MLMYIILILFSLSVIGGFFVSRFYINKFLMPIYLLTETIKSVKEGDLKQEAPIIYEDEIGHLAKEFNNMTKRLDEFEHSTKGVLLAEKNKSLAIVKSISDPLIVLDNNYKIILLNKACEEIFNISESNVLNKHFLEAIRDGEIYDNIVKTCNSRIEYVEKDPLKCSLNLISKDNTIDALEILKKCLVDDLINPEVYYQIGLVYQANGNDKISEKFFEISKIFK